MKHLMIMKKAVLLGAIVFAFGKCNSYGIVDLLNSSTDPNSTGSTTTSYRVFTASLTTLGDMTFSPSTSSCSTLPTGIERANCFCEEFAVSAGIDDPNTTFRAWLSDLASVKDANCNIQGIAGTSCGNNVIGSNYVDMMGNQIFYSWDDLSAGNTPLTAVYYNEFSSPSTNTMVWTGTNVFGNSTGSDCIGTSGAWSDVAASNATTGDPFSSSTTWTESTTTSQCGTPGISIYCFEGPN